MTLSSVGSAWRATEYGCELLVGGDVVGDEDGARLDLGTCELEQLLVVLLLGVEEHDVEDVVDGRERLEGVALEQVGPLLEAGLGDVPAPRVDLQRVVLEREHAAAEPADAGGEPDRRVAARAADLEHLAVGLRRDEREEEAARRRRDGAGAYRGGQPFRPLLGVLPLEAGEHCAHAIVQQSGRSICSRSCGRS